MQLDKYTDKQENMLNLKKEIIAKVRGRMVVN